MKYGGRMSYKIAIDGPSSAGKSTLAKMLAKTLGYVYIDTGAMYRAFALYLLEHNIDFSDENEIKKHLDDINISLDYDQNENLIVLLNGKDVTSDIRNQEVSNAASVSSQFKVVREKLVALQKEIAEEKSCVMDGRDIASNVLPNADLKIFLTATYECRAKRRYIEEKEKGIDTSIEKVLEELKERDDRDIHRENNPLICVDDAIVIDNTNLTVKDIVDDILKRYF